VLGRVTERCADARRGDPDAAAEVGQPRFECLLGGPSRVVAVGGSAAACPAGPIGRRSSRFGRPSWWVKPSGSRIRQYQTGPLSPCLR